MSKRWLVALAALALAGAAEAENATLVADRDNTLYQSVTGSLSNGEGIHMFAGYYDNDAANAAAFTEDGWFRSGDLAVMDTDGYVSLTGRSKDIINRGGVKYNPLDIERLLDQHTAVDLFVAPV